MRVFILLGLALSLQANEIALAPAWPELKFERPIAAAIPDDDSSRIFVVQQRGQIRIVPGGENFLDISDRKLEGHKFEEGLLGLAFHPQFRENRKFYIYYTQQDPKRTRVSEFQASADSANHADLSTERVLLEIRQPFWNHNSGNLLFGPDGFLYIVVGDGGKADDLRQLCQNLWALNGKMLRIDVDQSQGALPYAIPADNPFAKVDGVRPEIFALGLRNTWGVDFDRKTGVLWGADVGQEVAEEINHIVAGGNYGWSYREGTVPFVRRQREPPETMSFVEPIHTYGRDQGGSITGGFVYRGDALPKLKGHYIYGDWGTGRIWAMPADRPEGNRQIFWDSARKPAIKPAAFIRDGQGGILLLCWTGQIYGFSQP
ncbi:MAG: glucose/arabinose dehydrogenase [Rhodothermales bacterium]|jgi:glucose/arabinose dehydrogenase